MIFVQTHISKTVFNNNVPNILCGTITEIVILWRVYCSCEHVTDKITVRTNESNNVSTFYGTIHHAFVAVLDMYVNGAKWGMYYTWLTLSML